MKTFESLAKEFMIAWFSDRRGAEDKEDLVAEFLAKASAQSLNEVAAVLEDKSTDAAHGTGGWCCVGAERGGRERAFEISADLCREKAKEIS